MATATAPTSVPNRGDAGDDQYFKLPRLKRQFEAYITGKIEEIEEQKIARRYDNHVQWDPKDVEILRRRGQPVVTYPRVGRKIDGVVGITEQQRQDPKAYPRNPQDEDGAALATATVRYIMERNEWTTKKPDCLAQALVDGIAGIELRLVEGDEGDPDIEIEHVMGDDFFYDPRSIKPNFTDARYMGLAKWLDLDEAVELFPDKEDELESLVEQGSQYSTYSDRDIKWIAGEDKRIRLVEHWYKWKGKWCWAFYCGSTILAEGVSPFFDERAKTMCRFIMFSAYIDQDGDRYGMVRALKGMQDEINQRRSKALHISASRRLILERGAVDDVEAARREWAKPDGVIEVNPGKKITPDDTTVDLAAQFQFLTDAKNEMESYANINPAALAGGTVNLSGRAVNLLQKPGLAEIWKPVSRYRNFSLRVYRAVWNMAQRFWTSERWIRVTDSNRLAQYIQINGLGLDQYGRPQLVNAIGALDVDIILDEGPDVQTVMQDTWDVMAQLIGQLPPGTIPMDILVKLMPIDASVKEDWEKRLDQPPDPAVAAAKQLELHTAAAKIDETVANTGLKKAQGLSALASAAHKGSEAHLNAAAIFSGGLAQQASGAQPQQPAPQPAPPETLPSFAPPQPASPVPGLISQY